jgi:Helix-turn-helix domain
MNLEELPDVLTVEEAAAVLRIGRTAAYELCRQWRLTGGRAGLPVLTFGRTLRVPRAALARMLQASEESK